MSENGKNNFKIITLCGSTSFKNEFLIAAQSLTFSNYIVLMPHVFTHSIGMKLSEKRKAEFSNMHKQMIDMSEAIMVINKDGYIGESTKTEIEYAKSKGKKIYYRYSECKNDCIYNKNCNVQNIMPPFEKKFTNRYPICQCYRKKEQ